MVDLFGDDRPLPQFRKDLELFPGPEEPDGSPTFNIYDPVRAQFFKITWAESMVIKNLKYGMNLSDLCNSLDNDTTLKVSRDQVKYFLLDAFRHDLMSVVKPPEHYEKLLDYKRPGFFKWLLFNYLYIRIPIINPDPFLSKTVKYVRLLGSRAFLAFYALLSLVGILILFTRFGEFINTFTYFFNFQGLVTFAVAISCVKMVHEFSHAFTAKNFGVYVPSMGIVVIVLWPMLYTNVTDGWKLKNRMQRFCISIAGIVAELIIAGFSTIGWLLTDEGLLHSVFFVLASITWVSTLIINLNPGIRFDGYYILGDLWGIDNLQLRAFAVARWKLRELLLGLKAPPPEDRLSTRRIFGMVIYAIYTWCYRVILYTAIAVVVYYKFTKALGIFLFFLEISIFLLWPFWCEAKALFLMRKQMTPNPQSFTTFVLICAVVGWFVLPLPRTETFAAVTVAANEQIIYTPHAAIVKQVYIHRDQEVQKGDPLVDFYAPPLDSQIKQLRYESKILEREISTMGLTEKARPFISQKRAELESNFQKLRGLLNLREELQITAEVSGKTHAWFTGLKPGMVMAKNRIIGKVADISDIEVICFVPEVDIQTVKEGDAVRFRVTETNEIIPGRILRVSPTRTQYLKQWQLASVYQGSLPVTEEQQTGNLRMVESYYLVQVKLETSGKPLVRFGQTGLVEVDGPWRSRFVGLLQWVLAIFWRESSL